MMNNLPLALPEIITDTTTREMIVVVNDCLQLEEAINKKRTGIVSPLCDRCERERYE